MDKNIGWIRWRKPEWERKPFPPKSDSWRQADSTIYLTIASFRDKLCPLTLYNLFSKARYPGRIFPGVVQQNVEGTDLDCLDTYCMLVEDFGLGNFSAPVMDSILSGASLFKSRKRRTGAVCPFEKNVRMDRVDARIAQGPTWARARGSLLLRDEEFCMQTDAHMDFVVDWDLRMLEMWGATSNEYAILSTYVAPTEQLKFNEGPSPKGLNGLHEVPHLCMVTLFGSHELPRIWGTKCARSLPEPKLTNGIWGAGLSFSKCHAERKAPYDPHTPQIFDGEEFSRSIRFWTWGYDIYTPHRVNVVHNYHVSQSDPTHFDWARNAVGAGEASAVRLKTLIDAPGQMQNLQEAEAMRRSRYGLGDRRSLDQYIEFSGIDTRHRKILGNRCGNLDFVPYDEHPFGPDYIPQYHATTEDPLDPPDPHSTRYDAKQHAELWTAFAKTWTKAGKPGQGGGEGKGKGGALKLLGGPAAPQAISEAAFGNTLRRPASLSTTSAGESAVAGVPGLRHTVNTDSGRGRDRDRDAVSAGGLTLLLAKSDISQSDALLLGFTVAGIVLMALYALLCRRHFSATLLVARSDKQFV